MTDDQRRLIEGATAAELAKAVEYCEVEAADFRATAARDGDRKGKMETIAARWDLAAACVAAVAEQRRGGGGRG